MFFQDYKNNHWAVPRQEFWAGKKTPRFGGQVFDLFVHINTYGVEGLLSHTMDLGFYSPYCIFEEDYII